MPASTVTMARASMATTRTHAIAQSVTMAIIAQVCVNAQLVTMVTTAQMRAIRVMIGSN